MQFGSTKHNPKSYPRAYDMLSTFFVEDTISHKKKAPSVTTLGANEPPTRAHGYRSVTDPDRQLQKPKENLAFQTGAHIEDYYTKQTECIADPVHLLRLYPKMG